MDEVCKSHTGALLAKFWASAPQTWWSTACSGANRLVLFNGLEARKMWLQEASNHLQVEMKVSFPLRFRMIQVFMCFSCFCSWCFGWKTRVSTMWKPPFETVAESKRGFGSAGHRTAAADQGSVNQPKISLRFPVDES